MLLPLFMKRKLRLEEPLLEILKRTDKARIGVLQTVGRGGVYKKDINLTSTPEGERFGLQPHRCRGDSLTCEALI